MSIVKQYCKKTDTVYVYDCVSYYRPDKKRCYYKRKLIGKIDKATGQIVPTGKRGRPRKNTGEDNIPPSSNTTSTKGSDTHNCEDIRKLSAENASLRSEVESMKGVLISIQEALNKISFDQ